jgi:hypothetical protein
VVASLTLATVFPPIPGLRVRAPYSPEHVQELLGHAEIDSTMRYTRVDIGGLLEMIERAYPREKNGHGVTSLAVE